MKRVLMFCLLLVIAMGAAQAQAAPFYFGSDKLVGDTATLLDNLNALVPTGSGTAFQDVGPGAVASLIDPRYVTLVALSQSAYDNDCVMFVNDGASTSFVESYDLANTWAPQGLLAANISNSVAFLVGGMHDLVDVTISGAFVYGLNLPYKPGNDFASIEFVGGTVFAGLSFDNSGTLDAIIAIGLAKNPVVPVPGAVWLMGTGLAGLMALRRRNK